MAQNDIFQLRVNYQLSGQKLVNVMHFRNSDSTGTGDERQGLAAAFIQHLVPPLKACLSDQVLIHSVSVKGVGAAKSQYIDVSVSENGSVTADPLPTNIAVAITTYANGKGPQYRGRFYLPGCPEIYVSLGIVGDTLIGLLATLADLLNDQLTDPLLGYKFNMCIWSEAHTQIRDVSYSEPQYRSRSLYSRTIGVGS